MTSRKKINKMKLLAVFSMTTLIFLIGILLGGFIEDKKISEIQDLEQDLRTDTIATEIQFSLLSESPCVDLDTSQITEELYQVSSKISYMENQLGGTNTEVLRLKEYYSLLELRHWMLLKKMESQCNQSYYFIHYFYSNKGDCEKCEQQGFILNYIRKKYDNTRIYSYDMNNKNVALETLKRIYNVSGAPFLIIDNKPFSGFMTTEEIEAVLNEEG